MRETVETTLRIDDVGFRQMMREALAWQAEEWRGKPHLKMRLFGFALFFCLLWMAAQFMRLIER